MADLQALSKTSLIYGGSSFGIGVAIGSIWGLVSADEKNPAVARAASILLSPFSGYLPYLTKMHRAMRLMYPKKGPLPLLPISSLALSSDRVLYDLIDVYCRGLVAAVVGKFAPKWVGMGVSIFTSLLPIKLLHVSSVLEQLGILKRGALDPRFHPKFARMANAEYAVYVGAINASSCCAGRAFNVVSALEAASIKGLPSGGYWKDVAVQLGQTQEAQKFVAVPITSSCTDAATVLQQSIVDFKLRSTEVIQNHNLVYGPILIAAGTFPVGFLFGGLVSLTIYNRYYSEKKATRVVDAAKQAALTLWDTLSVGLTGAAAVVFGALWKLEEEPKEDVKN